MIENLFKELASLVQVESIALGGSRAGDEHDEKSDYDIYIYYNSSITVSSRLKILSKYCSIMEIGNHYWEYEDNCTLKDGTNIDIIYRNLDSFIEEIASVVEKNTAHNGYTTCMWHNLKMCKIIYDKNSHLNNLKKRFDVPYPIQLKKNIIERNTKLLYGSLPSYNNQIEKAIIRNDIVSINHRITAFIESYFDIIFALNELTHPGEKRLIELCKQQCRILPKNFEHNLATLLNDLFTKPDKIISDINRIIKELNKLLE
jgi:hypothetical protein